MKETYPQSGFISPGSGALFFFSQTSFKANVDGLPAIHEVY